MKAKQQEEGMIMEPKRQEREEPISLPACSRLWASTWSPSPALNPSSPATGLPPSQQSPPDPGCSVLHPLLCHFSHALGTAVLCEQPRVGSEFLPVRTMQ